MVPTMNKKFVEEYWEAISGNIKTPPLYKKYVSDPEHLGYIAFFEAAFPKYKLKADDLISEDDKIVVRGRFKGTHKGEFMGIPPTGKTIKFPFSVIYKITDDKISKSWMFIDRVLIMDQLNYNASHN